MVMNLFTYHRHFYGRSEQAQQFLHLGTTNIQELLKPSTINWCQILTNKFADSPYKRHTSFYIKCK